jgi:hypothetical protein
VIVTLYFRRFKIRNPFKASHPGWHQAVLANEKAEKIALEKAAKDAEKTFVRTLPRLRLKSAQSLTSLSGQKSPIMRVERASGAGGFFGYVVLAMRLQMKPRMRG